MRGVLLAAVSAVLLSGCPKPEDGCGDGPACADGQACVGGQCVRSCSSDADCNGRRCDVARGQCEGCVTDGDCAGGLVCGLAGVCGPAAGCDDDAECPAGFCNTTKRTCVQCLDDGDCTGGKVCNVDTGQCGAPAGSCSSDADCAGRHCLASQSQCVDCLADDHCGPGITCNTTAHVCQTPCDDRDDTEPNDTSATAATLSPGGSRTGQLCPADVDFVKLVLTSEGNLAATLSVENAAQPPGFALLDAGGAELVAATGTTATLTVERSGAAAGAYFLRLTSQGSAPTAYTLTTTFNPSGTACNQEASEPNDTAAQAATITPDGSARGGVLCAGDVDMLAVDAANGDRLRVAAAGQGGTSLNVELLDSTLAVIGTGSPLQTGALSAGRYIVKLSVGVSTVVPYTVAVTASAGPPPCRQVDAEPNDADGQAQSIAGDGNAVEGAICPGDVDRYKVVVAADERLTGALTITPGYGDGPLVIQLLNPGGTELATASTSIDVAELPAGTYQVVILGQTGGSQGAYSLVVTRQAGQVPLDPCEDQGAEPNNTSAEATAIALEQTVSARICSGDEDRYAIDLPAQGVLRVRLTFTHANGDLDLQLLDANEEVLASSTGVIDEEVAEVLLPAGPLILRVYGFRDATNPYVLTTAVASCAGDDAFEENDRRQTATPVGPGTIPAVRCPGDDDYFALVLNAQDSVAASVTGSNLTVEILDAEGAPLSAPGPTTGADALPAGRYLARVTGGNTTNVNYGLTIAVTAADARMCVDDGAEQDDAISDARRVPALMLADGEAVATGVACASDEDWVRFDVAGPTRIEADLLFDNANNDLDLYLMERRGYADLTRTLVSSNGTTDLERIEGSTASAGSVLLQVKRYSGTDAPQYTLRLRTQPIEVPDGGCADDLSDTARARANVDGGFEERNDDSFSNATSLSADGDNVSARAVCPDDTDWYSVYLTTGDRLNVDVRYTYAAGRDLDAKVYKPSEQNTAVAFGVSSDDDEHLEYTAVESGSHRIQVYGFNGASNTYSMSVSVVEGP